MNGYIWLCELWWVKPLKDLFLLLGWPFQSRHYGQQILVLETRQMQSIAHRQMLPRKLSGNFLSYGCQSSVRAACIPSHSNWCENPVPLNFFSQYSTGYDQFIQLGSSSKKTEFAKQQLKFYIHANWQKLFLEKQHGIQVCYRGTSYQSVS